MCECLWYLEGISLRINNVLKEDFIISVLYIQIFVG